MIVYRISSRSNAQVVAATAWFAREDTLVTAAHSVAGAGRWLREDGWSYELAGHLAVVLTPLVLDTEADIAVFDVAWPDGAKPHVIELARVSIGEGVRWTTEAYPNLQRGDSIRLTGHVIGCDGPRANRTVQLLVHQGTNVEWTGTSGAPVLVDGRAFSLVTNCTSDAATAWGCSPAALRRAVWMADCMRALAALDDRATQPEELVQAGSARIAEVVRQCGVRWTSRAELIASEDVSGQVPATAGVSHEALVSLNEYLERFLRLTRRFPSDHGWPALRKDYNIDLYYVRPRFVSIPEGSSAKAVSVPTARFFGDSSVRLVAAPPGSGKTSFLRFASRCALRSPEDIGLGRPHIPFLVSASDLHSASGLTLAERLLDALGRARSVTYFGDVRPPSGFLRQWQEALDGEALLLVDDLDALDDAAAEVFLAWLDTEVESARGRLRCVVAAANYTEQRQAQTLSILPFSIEETIAFVVRHCGVNEGAALLNAIRNRSFGFLLERPLLLSMAAAVYVRDNSLPDKRAKLLERSWESFRRQWRQSFGGNSPFEFDAIVAALARFARTHPYRRADRETFASALKEWAASTLGLSAFDAGRFSAFVIDQSLASGILEREEMKLSWALDWQRDVLAATQLAAEWRHLDGAAVASAILSLLGTSEREAALVAVGLLDSSLEEVACALVDNDDGAVFLGTLLRDGVAFESNTVEKIEDRIATLLSEQTFFSALASIAVGLWRQPQATEIAVDLGERSERFAGKLRQQLFDAELSTPVRAQAGELMMRLRRSEDLVACATDSSVPALLRIAAATSLATLEQRDRARELLSKIWADSALQRWERDTAEHALQLIGTAEEYFYRFGLASMDANVIDMLQEGVKHRDQLVKQIEEMAPLILAFAPMFGDLMGGLMETVLPDVEETFSRIERDAREKDEPTLMESSVAAGAAAIRQSGGSLGDAIRSRLAKNVETATDLIGDPATFSGEAVLRRFAGPLLEALALAWESPMGMRTEAVRTAAVLGDLEALSKIAASDAAHDIVKREVASMLAAAGSAVVDLDALSAEGTELPLRDEACPPHD